MGAVVMRGRDWTQGCEDGVPRSQGVVIGTEVTDADGHVIPDWFLVKWKDRFVGYYFVGSGSGGSGRFDLSVPDNEESKCYYCSRQDVGTCSRGIEAFRERVLRPNLCF